MKRLTTLRLLIPALSLMLLALALGLATYATHQSEEAYTRAAVQDLVRARLTQLQISSELLLQLGLNEQLQQLITTIAAEPDLVRILIVDAAGRVIAADRYALVGEHWQDAMPLPHDIGSLAATSDWQVRALLDPQHRFVDGYAPLCNQAARAALTPGDCGFIAYRVNLRHHYALTDQALRQQTGYFVVGVLAVFGLLLLALHLLVTRRARRIITGLQAFTGGERGSRVPAGRADELGDIGRTVNKVLDEIEHNERALLDQRERLRALFDTVPDAIITMDRHGIIQSVNKATEQLFGYAPGELVGRNVSVLAAPPHRARHDDYIRRYLETGERRIIGKPREVQAVAKDGRRFDAELSVSEMNIGGECMFTGLVRDITERVRLRENMARANAELKSTNQALWQSAQTDGLTGLANRRHFDDTLDAEIRRSARQGSALSLILLDLDHFKAYNDRYGHYEGDNCLKAVARVLAQCCQRSGELPARYGGEEFTVILPASDREAATALAEHIRTQVEALRLPHASSPISEWVTASVGVASYRPVDHDPVSESMLIKAADGALYAAKHGGRNRVCHAEVAPQARSGSTDGAQD